MEKHRLLPSWRDGQTRDQILSFLDSVGNIPVDDRVAVFDNDGTLWSEKPAYTQMMFFEWHAKRSVAADPSLRSQPALAALVDGDSDAISEMGLEGLAAGLLDLLSGMSPAAFEVLVHEFFDTVRHPTRDVHLSGTRYLPMLELIAELRDRQFDVFVVTGGGAEFVRPISQEFYGVPPEGVVGSQIDYRFIRDDEGRPGLVRTTDSFGGVNEGENKVTQIQRILGRRPCVAGGNSPGDKEMLEYAMACDGPTLALLVDHDDAEREYDYESVAGSYETEETATEMAERLGWTVVSILRDWETVYSEESSDSANR